MTDRMTDHLTVCPQCSTYKSQAEQQKESCGEPWFNEFLYAEMRWDKRFMLCSLHHQAVVVRLTVQSCSCVCNFRFEWVPSVSSGQWCFAAVIKSLISSKLIAFPCVMNQPTTAACFMLLLAIHT